MSSDAATAAVAAGDKRKHDAVAASASGVERLTKQRSDGQHAAETASVAASPAVRLLYKDSLQLVFTFGWATDQASASRVCRLWASAVSGARQAEAARISRLLASIRGGLFSDDLDELRLSVRDLRGLVTTADKPEPHRLIDALCPLLSGPSLGSTVVRLISLLSHADDALAVDAAWSIILLGLDFGFLVGQKHDIRRDACVALSRLCARGPGQIETVINANLMRQFVAMLKNDTFDTRKEAARAIVTALSGGTDAQIRYLVHQAGVIPPLCALLDRPEERLVLLAMSGIDAILRVGKLDAMNDPRRINQYTHTIDECRGFDYLEVLSEHENEIIYNKAASILMTYFVQVDLDDDVD